MKKLFALCLALVLALSLALVACGDDGSSSAPQSSSGSVSQSGTSSESTGGEDPAAEDWGGITIRISSYWGRDLTPGVSAEQDLFIERVRAVEEKYNCVIEFPGGPEEYYDNMVTTIMAGEPYGDLMFAFSWYFLDWIKAGAVKDLTSLDIDFNDPVFSPLSREEGTFRGQTYGFSSDTNDPNSLILFNKRIFEENNLESPYDLVDKGEWTFAKFKEYAKVLTADTNGDNVTDRWGLTGFDPPWIGVAMVYGNGGKVVDYSGDTPRFALGDAPAMEALDLFYEMLTVDKSIMTVEAGADWTTGPQAFVDGNAAMFKSEYWVQEWIMGQDMSDEFGVVNMPMGPQASQYADDQIPAVYFAPVGADDDKTEKAIRAYMEIFQPLYEDMTQAEILESKYMAVCQDERSVQTMVDTVMDGYQLSTGVGRAGLNATVSEIFAAITNGEGTPASIIAERSSAIQAELDERFNF